MTAPANCKLLYNPTASTELFTAIRNCTQSIRILAYQISASAPMLSTLRPSPWVAMLTASDHCPHLEIIINRAPPHSLQAAANDDAANILAARGWTVWRTKERLTMHAKVIVFDDRAVMLGSHNLTASAFTTNKELSILSESPALAASCCGMIAEIKAGAQLHGNYPRTSPARLATS